jgi:DNA-binding NarL/FixJ family response regulator
VTERPIDVLLVDDHAVVRLGLAALFATAPRLSVVGQASTAAEAMVAARRTHPDVVVMDVRLPDGSGVEACRAIRSERPETKVVMLTSFAEDEAVVASVLAGAAGYLLKSTAPERLIEAIELVAKGESLLDPGVTTAVLDRLRRGSSGEADPLAVLSEQERRIVPLIAEGKTNRDIASALHLSEHTIKAYVSDILRKLRLSRRAQAAALVSRLHPQPRPE